MASATMTQERQQSHAGQRQPQADDHGSGPLQPHQQPRKRIGAASCIGSAQQEGEHQAGGQQRDSQRDVDHQEDGEPVHCPPMLA